MKFTGPLSVLLVVLPLLALQANAAPSLVGRARGGGKGKGKGGAAAASSSAAAATSTSSAAGAAATDTAASAAASSSDTAAASSTASGAAAANTGAAGAGGDPQTSLTLDPSLVGPNLAKDGQGGAAEAGQVASLTSTNNFINFCLGKAAVTNGLQAQGGSCNPVPMGQIPAKGAQPSCKFTSPQNNGNAAAANSPFTISMQIQNLETGNFVNPNTNYFAAPQQLNAGGQIVGHSHVVVETLKSITDTTPLDPTKFAFFQGLNAAANNGVLTANVAKGLPAGAYRLFSINTAANHQPVIGPVAQHGAFDDAIYFTVGGAGGAANAAGAVAAANGTAAAGVAAASSTAADAASSSAAAGAGAASSAASSAAASATSAAATGAAGKGGKGGKGGKKGGRRSFVVAREN